MSMRGPSGEAVQTTFRNKSMDVGDYILNFTRRYGEGR